MKIGIFDPYLDTLGGGEKYILTAALCLAKEHKVSIFWDVNDTPDFKKRAKERFGFDFDNVNFTSNIFSPKISLFNRIQKVREYDYIIYLSDGSIPLTLTKNLIIHFQFPVEWINGQSLKTKLKLLQIKQIICNSKFTKSFIDKKFGIESIVVYPPVNIVKPQGEKENIILHVGRFGIDLEGENYKKQDVMIEAFKRMGEKSIKDWKFVMVISVTDKDKTKVEKLRNITRGFPIDIIENPDKYTLWQLYRKAKIYWHASGFGEDLQIHPQKAEHFGIATAEAMGAGAVPVVISAGGQLEIVKDGESGFLWNTIEELIQKTNMLMQNNRLLEEVSRNATKRAKIFSNERFCKQINKIIY